MSYTMMIARTETNRKHDRFEDRMARCRHREPLDKDQQTLEAKWR